VPVLRLETGIYQTKRWDYTKALGFQRRPRFGKYKDYPLSAYYEKTIA